MKLSKSAFSFITKGKREKIFLFFLKYTLCEAVEKFQRFFRLVTETVFLYLLNSRISKPELFKNRLPPA